MTQFTRQSAMLSSLDGDAPYTINGVAIGDGDVTKGSSGVEKEWPGEELEKAASSLMGRPLVVDHDNSADGVVGKVTKADYKENVGVLYEAQLYDEELAKKVHDGLLEVSIRGYHIDVDEMEESEEGAKIVEGIKFDNLSIVPVGAAPSNTLQMGEAADLSEAQLEEYVGELQEEIEPGQFVQWGDKQGIVLLVEDGEAEVDIYTEADDGWSSSGETEMVSTGQLSSWDVDEEDITSMDDSDSSDDEDSGTSDDEEESQDSEDGDIFVQWEDGRGRVVEENDGMYTVELFEQADDGVWEPTGDQVEVEEASVDEWQVTEESEASASNDELSVDGVSTGDAVKWSSDDGGEREPSGERYGVVVDELQDSDEGSVLVAVYQATSDYEGWENRNEQEKMKAESLEVIGSDGKASLPSVSQVVEENAEGTEKPLFRRDKEGQPHRYPEGDEDEELAEATVHDLSYSGTENSRDWSKPSLSDFTDDSWDDVSNDERKSIGGHFFASTSGFPADSFGDMKLPAVWPNGDLSYDGLTSARSMAKNTDGLSSDQQETVQSKADNLLESKFDGGDSEENNEGDGGSDHLSIPVMSGDDLSASNVTGDSEQLKVINMGLEDKIDDLDNPVALEASELEELRQTADEYEELKEEQQTVSEMSETLSELRERQAILDDVPRDLVEELRDSDDAIVVESARFEELESEAETVKTLYAERVSEEMSAFDADELKDKFTIDELREKYEAIGGDIEEELTPDPKSTDPSNEEVEEAQEGEPSEEDEDISAKQEELRGKLFG